MKALFCFLLLLMSTSLVRAQHDFAPPGSAWHHTGSFYSFYDGDTVILGIKCRKVTRVDHSAKPIAPSTFYFYNNPDTVFIYNTVWENFTPLYVFNVKAGDTLRLYIPPGIGKDYGSFYTLANFIVDSVKTVVYDTSGLRTVFTHSSFYDLSNFGKYIFSFGYDTTGAYAEKIGSIDIGFLPNCLSCPVIMEAVYPSVGKVRCYSDSNLSVHLTTDTCEIPYDHTVAANIKKPLLSVFPDPASAVLNIAGLTTHEPCSIRITDMQGREMIKLHNVFSAASLQVNISHLSAGIYIITLTTTNDMKILRFVKE